MSEKNIGGRSGNRVREDRTDWGRLTRLTDDDNEKNIATDFDSWPLDDQARGYFFHIYRIAGGRWSWDLVGADGAIVARAPDEYETRESADAATRQLKARLKAA